MLYGAGPGFTDRRGGYGKCSSKRDNPIMDHGPQTRPRESDFTAF